MADWDLLRHSGRERHDPDTTTERPAMATDPPSASPAPAPVDPAANRRRPPTAPLPLSHRPAREVSAIPPTRPVLPGDGDGVAAQIVPTAATRSRQTRDELLRRVVTGARLASLMVPVAFTILGPGGNTIASGKSAGAFVVAVLLTGIRAWRPVARWPDQVFDTVVVASLLAVSGGIAGPLVFFAAATAFASAVSGSYPAGLPTAAILSFVGVLAGSQSGAALLLPSVVVDQAFEPLRYRLRESLFAIALNPVLVVIGSLASFVTVDNRAGQATLVETNRVLGNLDRLTSAAPESLSPNSVGVAAAREFRTVLDGQLALVLFERSGSLVELGRDGPVDAGPHVLLDAGWEDLVRGTQAHVVDEGSFPVRLIRQLPTMPTWVAVPLRAREHRVGVVLIGASDFRVTRKLRQQLKDRAVETAVALDNTQLFAKIEQAAATTERQRLASDLHDGVAQQLTHVRFELELLARGSQDPTTRSELSRLARVAERATDDVRSSIRGLRAQALDVGLVPALRALVTDLDGSSGPHLDLDIRGGIEADPDTEAELYRIAQEALSNALRHAQADNIVIEMDVVQGMLVLAVEDDGVGLHATGRSTDGDGMGLRTMQARAERLGAQFNVRPADLGGTRMELRMPVEEARHG